MSDKTPWALILGASSGFGGATARALAKAGMNIIGVHFDMRSTRHLADAVKADVEAEGREALFFNKNADEDRHRAKMLDAIAERFSDGEHTIRVLMHSIAFGTLKPYFAEEEADRLSRKNFDMTLSVMANCLVYWAQDLVGRDMMHKGGRIYAMTSAGGHLVWPHYGAVSAAKAAIESHIRQLALELSPRGISANSIQAGVTDAPALRKIPGSEAMLAKATAANPSGRLTTPEEVARVISVLSHPDLDFMTGNLIRVDGGEDITS